MSTETLSLLYITLIFIIGFLMSAKTAKRIKNKIVFVIFMEHMLFSYLFYIYAQSHSADANMYYARAFYAKSLLGEFGTDTQFVIFLTTFFVQLGFSKLATFFLYGLFGFIGFQYLIRMLDYSKIQLFGFPMVFLVLLLPEFHFWTSAIGKDSLVFMSLMMFFYGLQYPTKRFFLLILSLTFLAYIRPHIGFVIMMAISVSLFLRNPLKYKSIHILTGFVSVALIIIFIPFIKSFLNIDELELKEINERVAFYTDYGAQNTDELSSYIDVRSYSLPLKMFSYLFRPLFFDARSVLQLLASIENLVLLLLIYKWLNSIRFKIFKWYKLLNDPDKIMFIYVLIGWVILSASMYNLGLASRQKYMLLPILFILIFRNLQYAKHREFHK